MNPYLYILLLFTLIVTFHKGRANRLITFFDFCLATFLYINFVVMATYNNDWEGYENEYESLKDVKDFGWYISEEISRGLGLSYNQFYIIVQSFIGLCILYTVRYFYGKEYTLVILFDLFFLMPNSSILIRNYFSYSFFLLCLISYCKSKKLSAFILGSISFSIHSGILLLLPLFLFKKVVEKNKDRITTLIKICLIISALLFILQTLLFSILDNFGLTVFSVYKNDISSIPSTLFMLLLYFSIFSYAIVLSKWMLNSFNVQRKNILMLISVSLYSLLFISMSRIQIIYFRLYEPLLLLSFISIMVLQYDYFIKEMEHEKRKSFPLKLINSSTIFVIFVFMILHKYVILGLFTGGSEWLAHYRDIILSNDSNILFYAFK